MGLKSPELVRITAARWIEFQNNSGEVVPAFAIMEVTGVTYPQAGKTVVTVVKPTAADLCNVMANGPTNVRIGGYGMATYDFPAAVLYDTAEGTPSPGDKYGTKAGQWTLEKDNAGFCIVGGQTNGRVVVVPNPSTTSQARWIEFTTRSGHTGFPATCDVDDFHQGSDPGATVTVADPAVLFPVCNGVGFKGIALYDDGDDQYVVVEAQELAYAYLGTLQSGVTSTSDTSVINSPNILFPGRGKLAGSITAQNDLGFDLPVNADVIVFYNHGDTPTYTIGAAAGMASQARVIEFTTRTGHASFPAVCDVDDYHQGSEPPDEDGGAAGVQVTVTDPVGLFPVCNGVGFKGVALFDDVAGNYFVIEAQELAYAYLGTLDSDVNLASNTSTISSINLLFPGRGQVPAAITAKNNLGFEIESGETVLVVYNHGDTPTYTIAGVRPAKKALIIEFTTDTGFTGFPGNCEVQDWHMGPNPGDPVTVADSHGIWTEADFAGLKGIAFYDNDADQYEVIFMEERAPWISGELVDDLYYGDTPTPVRSSNLKASPAPVAISPSSGKLPSGTITVWNEHDYSIPKDKKVAAVWDKSQDKYIVMAPGLQDDITADIVIPTQTVAAAASPGITTLDITDSGGSALHNVSVNTTTDEASILRHGSGIAIVELTLNYGSTPSGDGFKAFAVTINMTGDAGGNLVGYIPRLSGVSPDVGVCLTALGVWLDTHKIYVTVTNIGTPTTDDFTVSGRLHIFGMVDQDV